MSTVNAELFRAIADEIERRPGRYVQKDCELCIFAKAIEILAEPELDFIGSAFKPAPSVAGKMGISNPDAYVLCASNWKPRPGLTVPEALRLIADGASVGEVSAP